MPAPSSVIPLPRKIDVINIGLPLFEESIRSQGAPVIGVDWQIPCGGESDVISALARLMGPKSSIIDAANAEVVARLNNGAPLLKGVERAGAVVPGMSERTLLHCGPAIAWADMCDPLRRSIKAAIIAEGWAGNIEAAARLIASREIELRPANEHSTVVPMATVIGPSAPVYVVENEMGRTIAFSSINQGAGETQWFGVDSSLAIDRLFFIRDVIGPVIGEAIARRGAIDVLSLAAQGVVMGDDVHIRVQATTCLLLRDLLPFLMRVSRPGAGEAADFLSRNHTMFLNIAMAAAKTLVDSAAKVENSSIVTTMSRNGVTYGIRLAGLERWFLAAAPPIQKALYFPGYGLEASAADIGDSAVLELIGLGGAVSANSPAVAGFLGGRMADAIAATRNMQRICAGESRSFLLPILENAGAPLGVDVRRVVELAITPAVNTGVIHAFSGAGQIGAGVASAPIDCFIQALMDLDQRIM